MTTDTYSNQLFLKIDCLIYFLLLSIPFNKSEHCQGNIRIKSNVYMLQAEMALYHATSATRL